MLLAGLQDQFEFRTNLQEFRDVSAERTVLARRDQRHAIVEQRMAGLAIELGSERHAGEAQVEQDRGGLLGDFAVVAADLAQVQVGLVAKRSREQATFLD